jgi:hypothetical protein
MNSPRRLVYAKNHLMGKITLSLALTIALLAAPAAPIEIAKIASPHASSCPVMHRNMDPCQRCPMTPTSSSSGSTCCSVQAPCFVAYSDGPNEFIAGMSSTNFKSFMNDRVTARFQRPPVPPPRDALS